jgi:site-specific DNA recombinase
MTAAIYARKSTEQAGVADVQKSVARQIEHARAYATRKGWTVADEHVYVDDGISGAEFANRPGYQRLMGALTPRALFQILIMSEESRLGREAIETGYALKQLVTAGVRVFFYLEDRELTLGTMADDTMMFLRNQFSAEERRKASQRSTDSVRHKFALGHVVGGRVFGYDNERVAAGHVERRLNDPEAAIVRRIFDLYAAGNGYSRIVKLLNAEVAPAPKPYQGRPAGWSPSSVFEVLRRPLYRGDVVWNRTRKRDLWGQVNRSRRPDSDLLTRHDEALRIVSETQWRAAETRLRAARRDHQAATRGQVGGRSRDVDSRYLLPGFARCAVCGDGLGVLSHEHAGNLRIYRYGCVANHKRGENVCGNALKLPIERVDQAVLGELGGKVLRPAVVMAIVDGVLEAMRPGADDVGRQRDELRRIEREIGRFVEAIAAGGPLASLVERLKAREQRRDELARSIAAREGLAVRRFDRKSIEQTARAHCDRWRQVLSGGDVQEGRGVLREVLEGPLRFTPDERTYRFEGLLSFGKLLAGIVPFSLATNLVGPPGIEPGTP